MSKDCIYSGRWLLCDIIFHLKTQEVRHLLFDDELNKIDKVTNQIPKLFFLTTFSSNSRTLLLQ
jgi:hypothetical protein